MIQELGDVTGFVLAGGNSSRMGRDKALVELAGEPLVSYGLASLRRAGMDAAIAGSRSGLEQFAPIIADEAAGLGPLGGICSALRQASSEWAVFTTVDLPLMPPSLLRYLVFHARMSGEPITIASLNGFAQTFPAVIRRDALAMLADELACGRSGCFAAFKSAGVAVVPVELLVQAGQVTDDRGMAPFQWFQNVNTPEDLARLNQWARTGAGLSGSRVA